MAVYESDPAAQDDSRFAPGQLDALVVGNRGRLLDARRTPIAVVGVEPARGQFVVRIEAFEDQGTSWELGLDQVGRFQFPRDAPRAAPALARELAEARERFGRTVRIETKLDALPDTLAAIATEQRRAEAVLTPMVAGLEEPEVYVARRAGDPRLMGALEHFLGERDIAGLDRELASALVSNPQAGELVKAHAMVLAGLGLGAFEGQVLRDPDQLRAPWSWDTRRRHIVARLGFLAALWSAWKIATVTLYRGAAAERQLEATRADSFVSATFAREVAEAHFEGGPATVVAAMWRQRVPVGRIFMTFLETEAQNERFREAEAVLIGDSAGPAF